MSGWYIAALILAVLGVLVLLAFSGGNDGSDGSTGAAVLVMAGWLLVIAGAGCALAGAFL